MLPYFSGMGTEGRGCRELYGYDGGRDEYLPRTGEDLMTFGDAMRRGGYHSVLFEGVENDGSGIGVFLDEDAFDSMVEAGEDAGSIDGSVC